MPPILRWDPSVSLGDILAFLGELIVAWVIYREVSASRETTFLTEVDDKTYKQRAGIYETFVNQDGTTASEKARRFAETVRTNQDLRIKIENQMVVFARAFMLLRSPWFLRRRNPMLEWYPHVIVKMWVVCHVYIIEHDAGVFRWDIRMWSELVPMAMKRMEAAQRERARENTELVIYSGERTIAVDSDELRKIVGLATSL